MIYLCFGVDSENKESVKSLRSSLEKKFIVLETKYKSFAVKTYVVEGRNRFTEFQFKFFIV